MTVVESLSEYTRRIIREKELNYRKVADAAKAAGYEISHSTVGNIVNKSTEDVGVETLRALAHGLGVPEDELINIAAKNSTSSARRQAGFEKSEWAL
jgi:transcriptional regulator with XRE-family HTH domain